MPGTENREPFRTPGFDGPEGTEWPRPRRCPDPTPEREPEKTPEDLWKLQGEILGSMTQ